MRGRVTRLAVSVSGAFTSVLKILFTERTRFRWMTVHHAIPPRLAERTSFGKPEEKGKEEMGGGPPT
jgi:hypothetical protein